MKGNTNSQGRIGTDATPIEIWASGIEIKSSTPYIDFHFDNSTADQTSRIIETSSGTLNINNMKVTKSGTNSIVTSQKFMSGTTMEMYENHDASTGYALISARNPTTGYYARLVLGVNSSNQCFLNVQKLDANGTYVSASNNIVLF